MDFIWSFNQLFTDEDLIQLFTDGDNKNDDMSQMVEEYIKEIEELRTKLMESESTCAELRKAASRSRINFNSRAIERKPFFKSVPVCDLQ